MKVRTTWSYSSYKLYAQCPFKYMLKYIEKLKEPQSPALDRGIKIHDEAERYLRKPRFALPKSLCKMEEEFKALKALKPISEEKWAVNDLWDETGWDSPDVWLRFKLDACYAMSASAMKVVDFKTGKMYDDYDLQLDLYSAGLFSLYDVELVEPELWYLDIGKKVQRDGFSSYKVEEYEGLKRAWNCRVDSMFSDKRFSPTKNAFCGWCNWKKANGGPCKY